MGPSQSSRLMTIRKMIKDLAREQGGGGVRGFRKKPRRGTRVLKKRPKTGPENGEQPIFLNPGGF